MTEVVEKSYDISENTLILTNNGYKTMKEVSELTDQDKCFYALNRTRNTCKAIAWETGDKQVVEIQYEVMKNVNGAKTREVRKVTVAIDQILLLKDGRECPAKKSLGKDVMIAEDDVIDAHVFKRKLITEPVTCYAFRLTTDHNFAIINGLVMKGKIV